MKAQSTRATHLTKKTYIWKR